MANAHTYFGLVHMQPPPPALRSPPKRQYTVSWPKLILEGLATAVYIPRTDAGSESINDVEANAESLEARSGVRPGTVFITSHCSNNRDCATGCCGFITARCAGPLVAMKQDGGYGFGDSHPRNPHPRL